MEHVTGRLERDVERLREEVRTVHAIALRAETKVDTHEDSCVEASRRTYEKIDGVDRKVDSLDRKMDDVKRDLSQRRTEDATERRERQELIDETTGEWRTSISKRLSAQETWNRRVGVAVVIAAIAIVGGILGTAAKPFVGPAVEALKQIR